jgi:Icc-related predicted phosphoesterase
LKLRLFFATDLHGSTRCFSKFLSAATSYDADVLFFGGDYCSKDLVVFRREAAGFVVLRNDRSTLQFDSPTEFAEYRRREEFRGSLFHEMSGEPFESLDSTMYARFFHRQMKERLIAWGDMARSRLSAEKAIYVIPGNDDDPAFDDVFATPPFRWVHRSHKPFWHHWSVFAWGGSNPTPWRTIREFPESEIARQMEAALDPSQDPATTIFFIHPPPLGSGLDSAPALGAQFQPQLGAGAAATISVGSGAVRDLIDRWQPALGLFGHVHESAGRVQIGRTLCVNPGSQYYSGRLAGAIIDLKDNRVERALLTEG